jgi:hypothetical protein
MKQLLIFWLWIGIVSGASAQTKKYRVCIVAFYNLENLYDTINNPMVNDDEFTPSGAKRYGSAIYSDKLTKLATVISMIGSDISPSGPALLGVAEVENDTVLNDLVQHALLQHRQYKIIHFNSKDERGVDVALLYNPRYFFPEKAEKLFVPLPRNSKAAYYTRDILYVQGQLGGERVHVYVNHWPSRRGGEERSEIAREAAAAVCRKHINSVLEKESGAKIIVMGDLNDNPDNQSITDVLKAKGNRSALQPGELFNPWAELYDKGIGSLANRDSWGLFDQIILSQSWLNDQQPGLYYYQQKIFSRHFMMENSGRFKGYPMRTWDGNTYRGGYCDHFPTYIILVKKIN